MRRTAASLRLSVSNMFALVLIIWGDLEMKTLSMYGRTSTVIGQVIALIHIQRRIKQISEKISPFMMS